MDEVYKEDGDVSDASEDSEGDSMGNSLHTLSINKKFAKKVEFLFCTYCSSFALSDDLFYLFSFKRRISKMSYFVRRN